MGNQVPMLRYTARVRDVVELCEQPLEIDAIGPDAHVEVIVAVGIGRDEQPVGYARSPVAIDAAEEELPEAPLRADVRLGGAAGDDAVLLAEVIGIPLESRVDVRM